MTQIPPYQRPVNTVFQSYALFSHLNVESNIAFGLKIQNLSRGEIQTRVRDSLKLVRLDALAKRFPSQLSGGEQQRVALARALVMSPKLVLADEPTGNLDSNNSNTIQELFFSLNARRGTTFLVVTHSSELSRRMPRVVTMRDGRVESDVRNPI